MDPETPHSNRQRARPRPPAREVRQWVDLDHLLHPPRRRDQMGKAIGVGDHREDPLVEEAEEVRLLHHPHRLLEGILVQKMRKHWHQR